MPVQWRAPHLAACHKCAMARWAPQSDSCHITSQFAQMHLQWLLSLKVYSCLCQMSPLAGGTKGITDMGIAHLHSKSYSCPSLQNVGCWKAIEPMFVWEFLCVQKTNRAIWPTHEFTSLSNFEWALPTQIHSWHMWSMHLVSVPDMNMPSQVFYQDDG